MQDRAKYLPLLHEKYQRITPQYPDLIKQIEEREKFYLDMIYTYMTKNKSLEEKLAKAIKYSKSLEEEIKVRNQINHNIEREKREQSFKKQEGKQSSRTDKINHVTFSMHKPFIPQSSPIIHTPKITNNSSIIRQNLLNSPRRNVYLQDRQTQPNTGQNPQILRPNHQQQFKQKIIQNLNPHIIYTKKVYGEQSDSQHRSLNRSSLNNSKSQAKLSYQKYLMAPMQKQRNNSRRAAY